MSFARYAAWLRLTMSLEDAKGILGFPPSADPSPVEISKAYKQLALVNHPDRGGDHKRMVELNTAKEILDGKTTPGLRQRPTKSPADDERERAVKERIRRESAMNTIDRAADKAVTSLRFALGSAIPWEGRIDLKEFLLDTYADTLDDIHHEVEITSSMAKDSDWQETDRLCQKLASRALRLGSSVTKLRKKKDALDHDAQHGTVHLEDVSSVYYDVEALAEGLKGLYVESGKLMTLINTTESVPLRWDDLYSKHHQMIIAFKDDFSRWTTRSLKAFEDQLERSVETTLVTLDEFKVKPFSRDWKKWSVREDFDNAVELFKKYAKTSGTASNVAARYKANK